MVIVAMAVARYFAKILSVHTAFLGPLSLLYDGRIGAHALNNNLGDVALGRAGWHHRIHVSELGYKLSGARRALASAWPDVRIQLPTRLR